MGSSICCGTRPISAPVHISLSGKNAIVTGGTMGIGRAAAIAISRAGANCIVTCKWGTASEAEVAAAFEAAGAQPPLIIQSDVGDPADLNNLLAQAGKRWDRVDILVSNVSVALLTRSLEDYSLRALNTSIRYTAWPLFEYTQKVREKFGKYPRYVIGMSSPGPDSYNTGYDFAAYSKAVLETMCRYMSYRLFDEDIRINIVRSVAVRTAGWLRNYAAFEEWAQKIMREEHYISPEEIANVVLALCSGYMDGMRGQVITADRGISQFDNLIGLYTERGRLGL